MKNFRDELKEIFNKDMWGVNETFEAIDELHEQYYETLKQSQTIQEKIEYSEVYATAYQLLATGSYLNFDGKGKIFSEIIYVNYPTEKDKDIFKNKCCNSKNDQDLFDLDPDKIEISVLKLKLQIVDKK